MTNRSISAYREELGADDSILVDSSALTAAGADVFFGGLVDFLPKLGNYTLIIPLEAVNRINAELASPVPAIREAAAKAVSWLNKAVALSAGKSPRVIFVGEAKGAFADMTVLNQVAFLMTRHNVLLITQDEERTKAARGLRNPSKQGDHRLHCCRIKPDGTLGLYYFPEDEH